MILSFSQTHKTLHLLFLASLPLKVNGLSIEGLWLGSKSFLVTLFLHSACDDRCVHAQCRWGVSLTRLFRHLTDPISYGFLYEILSSSMGEMEVNIVKLVCYS